MHQMIPLILLLTASVSANELAGETGDPQVQFETEKDIFLKDETFRRQVDFWIKTFSQYDEKQGMIHDSYDVGIVYEVLDLSGLSALAAKTRIRNTKNKWKKVLLEVERHRSHPEKMSENEKHVFQMFVDSRYYDTDRAGVFRHAAGSDRLRFQTGLNQNFRESLVRSGQFMSYFKQILKSMSVPSYFARLPFVESGFRIFAHSKVGAKGIWQFMPNTGQRYLKVNYWVDERLDFLRSTEAAAQFLKENYLEFRSWGLAAVAYNHGPAGVREALKQVGSRDIRDILLNYKDPNFKFASRNFFAELLAAVEIHENYDQYFRGLKTDRSLRFVEVAVADYIKVSDLLKGISLDEETFRELNPAFKMPVWMGRMRIPALYKIKIPTQWGDVKGDARQAFWIAYNRIPKDKKFRYQVGAQPVGPVSSNN